MFKFIKFSTASAVLVATIGLSLPSAATAAILACDGASVSPDVTSNVTANIGCEILTDKANDSDTAVSGMFGITSWMQIDKVDSLPGEDGYLTLAGTTKSGTWAVDQAVFDSYTDVMLIFKDGNTAQPSNIVGYLIDVTSGDYSAPFYNANTQKDISHVSLYVSGVPIPAAAWLFGSGLIGLAGIARKRKTS